jgi:hypothetical protein
VCVVLLGRPVSASDIIEPSTPYDPTQEALIVLAVKAEPPADAFGLGLPSKQQVVIVQLAGTQRHQSFIVSEKPQVFRLPPGRFVVRVVSDRFIDLPEPIPNFTYDSRYDVPIHPFEIHPGDVLDLGTLHVIGLRGSQIVALRTPSISYRVTDDFPQARDAVASRYSIAAAQLRLELLVIDAQP